MRRSVRSALMAGTMLAGVAAAAGAQELVTTDRVGSADAPNVLTVRANTNQTPNSPTPGHKAEFEKV